MTRRVPRPATRDRCRGGRVAPRARFGRDASAGARGGGLPSSRPASPGPVFPRPVARRRCGGGGTPVRPLRAWTRSSRFGESPERRAGSLARRSSARSIRRRSAPRSGRDWTGHGSQAGRSRRGRRALCRFEWPRSAARLGSLVRLRRELSSSRPTRARTAAPLARRAAPRGAPPSRSIRRRSVGGGPNGRPTRRSRPRRGAGDAVSPASRSSWVAPSNRRTSAPGAWMDWSRELGGASRASRRACRHLCRRAPAVEHLGRCDGLVGRA